MPKLSEEPILIGCELFIRKGDKLLLGLRGRECFGAGTWALPGGHLEYNERLVDAACREILEELGAEVTPKELRLACITDSVQSYGNHYVHVSFELKEPDWEPRIMEPDSCDEWRYFPIDKLPDGIFVPHKDIIDNYLNKRLYKN